MNDRITELLPKPFRVQGQQISYDGYDKAFCDLYSVEQINKFAKLIIEECSELTLDYKNDQHYNGWLDYRDEIKKHFGIQND